MATGKTPVRQWPYPAETDVPDVAADIKQLATALDVVPVVGQGVLSARPASSAPGNRFMVQGDPNNANNGIEWYDTGSGWIQAGAYVPTGALFPFAGSSAPAGFLICDGSAVSRSTYAALFAVIGSTFGAGDGSTTFNVPDLRSRVAVGAGNGFNLAGTGGEQNHTLTPTEMPSHGHGVTDPGHGHTVYDPGHGHGVSDPGHHHGVGYKNNNAAAGTGAATPDTANTSTLQSQTSGTGISIQGSTTGVSIYGNYTGITISAAGGGAAHNNMQPYIVLTQIIKT